MKLIIVSGISGLGKSTLVKQFIDVSRYQYELIGLIESITAKGAE